MAYNPNIHHRRSIRLKGYDYSQAGLYYITICVQNRVCLFGNVAVWAPLVGAQNNGNQNNRVQNVDAKNDGIKNDDIIQNETGFGNDNGRADNDGSQMGRPQIGRPQGHTPTVATMILNDAGLMVETEWLKLTERFPNIELHEYVVMPNHFHAILQIVDAGASLVGAQSIAQNKTNDCDEIAKGRPQGREKGRPQGHAPTADMTTTKKTVGDMLDAFKSITTVEYIHGVKTLGWPRFYKKLWQRDYWEHIIRDERSYLKISEYIINNPKNWNTDKLK